MLAVIANHFSRLALTFLMFLHTTIPLLWFVIDVLEIIAKLFFDVITNHVTDVIVNHFPRLVFDVITNEICPSLFVRITFRQRLEVIGLKSHAKYAVMSVCLSVRPASPRDTRAKTLGGIRHGGSRQPRRRTFSISLSSSSSTRSEKSFFWFS